MPRPPVPVHRGLTPEQSRQRRLVSGALSVAAGAVAFWTLYGEFAHDHGTPHSLLRGGLGVGLGTVILFLSYRWAPSKADQLKE